MKNILITGGSGLVGKQLTTLLEQKGYEVAWLSRKPQRQTHFLWDVARQEIDPIAPGMGRCSGAFGWGRGRRKALDGGTKGVHPSLTNRKHGTIASSDTAGNG